MFDIQESITNVRVINSWLLPVESRDNVPLPLPLPRTPACYPHFAQCIALMYSLTYPANRRVDLWTAQKPQLHFLVPSGLYKNSGSNNEE